MTRSANGSPPLVAARRLERLALVSFDVFDDRRRRSVRRVLRQHGDWFQQSLWIAERSSRVTVERLTADLGSELTGRDRAVLHRPCDGCAPLLWWYPTHRAPTEGDGAVIT